MFFRCVAGSSAAKPGSDIETFRKLFGRSRISLGQIRATDHSRTRREHDSVLSTCCHLRSAAEPSAPQWTNCGVDSKIIFSATA
jgi:hypothetical protein